MAKVSAVILIYDIRGFTAASKKLPSTELGAFATAAHRAIYELFAEHPPDWVKNLGDGHLLIWETDSPPDKSLVEFIVAAATRARAIFPAFVAGHLERRGHQGTRFPTRVGIGVVVGEVSREGSESDKDYYGAVVNLAARLQNMARPEGLAMDGNTFEFAGKRHELIKRGFRKRRLSLKGLGSTLVWIDRPFSWQRVLASALPYAATIALVLGYLILADVGNRVPGGELVRTFLDRHEWSVFRPTRQRAEVLAGARQTRLALTDRILAGRLKNGTIALDLNRPEAAESDMWSTSQAVFALICQPHLSLDTKREWLSVFETFAFNPGVFIPEYGWPPHAGTPYTEAEPALWTVIALARALAEPNLIEPAARPKYEDYLSRAQKAAMRFNPRNSGKWNTYPNQADPDRHSPYATTLGLLALLENHAARQPWLGSIEECDRLLHATASFLAQSFEEKGGSWGWRRTADPGDPISEGLTLQIFYELLRAEKEAGIGLSDKILEELPKRLWQLSDRRADSQSDAGEYMLKFTDHEGRPQLGGEAINFLWHPWAVATCVQWLDRAERIPPPKENVTRVRRTLGYLVVDLHDATIKDLDSGMSFALVETIYCLGLLPEK